jgi:hypothetical protein
VLRTTLAMKFEPGTNLKGEVIGANWIFLLPTLALDRVVCLGLPPFTTLSTLARHARQVVVLSTQPVQAVAIASQRRRQALPNVHLLRYRPGEALPLAPGSADLLLLQDRALASRFERDEALQVAASRVLGRDGLVYLEHLHLRRPPALARRRSPASALFPGRHCFQLQPPFGEPRLAAPDTGDSMLRDVMDRLPYHPALVQKLLRPVKRRFQARKRRAVGQGQATGTGERHTRSRPSRIRTLSKGTMRLLEAAEEAVVTRQPLVRRYGVLLSRHDDGSASRALPAYLRKMASGAGLEAGRLAWVLAAPTDYVSRKVLFFLCDQDPGAGVETRYVAKLVRKRALNSRLENEYRALTSLYERGIGDEKMLPRPLFLGHHDGLAITGQAQLEGTPFADQTAYSEACPYARAAVEWLVELGAATAAPGAASASSAGCILQQLWTQFAGIYDLSPEARRFMEGQVDVLLKSREPFPAVFQHGDPGTWNVLVTPSGQIAFLDWEAAEEQGMPLWDLFYFLRSYVVGSGRAMGLVDNLTSFQRLFLEESSFSPLVTGSVDSYCRRTGVPRSFVAPLFYTCWMHRALKEAARLRPGMLHRGHYFRLLSLCIDQHKSPVLQQLFHSSESRTNSGTGWHALETDHE